MAMLFKCSACNQQQSLPGRASAIAAGYTFAEINGPDRVRYFVLCPCVSAGPWIAKTLTDEAKRGKTA